MGYTLVTFHAHPDDEAIATGGTMARAKAEGHRVVLVLATRGELGEYAPDALAPGETLTDRRVAELHAAAESSASTASSSSATATRAWPARPTNDDDRRVRAADVDEAAARLAELLREEDADVLTVYDDHGGYGHPDHVQVHRVGVPRGRARRHAARLRVDDEPRLHPAA